MQAFLLASAEHLCLHHPAAEVKEHDGVEGDGAKLGKENPDVVAPEALVFVFGTQPTLWEEREVSYLS